MNTPDHPLRKSAAGRVLLNAAAPLILAAAMHHTAGAATVSYTHETPAASLAGDLLLGVVPTANSSFFSTSPAGNAIITDGDFTHHTFSTSSPWDLIFLLGDTSSLGSVDIWIEDGDPSRWYLPSGQVSVSLDGTNWTNAVPVDNQGVAGQGPSPDDEINRIHINYAPGEVAAFRYLRVSELAGGLGNSGGTPRIKEIAAFAVPEPAVTVVIGCGLVLAALFRRRLRDGRTGCERRLS